MDTSHINSQLHDNIYLIIENIDTAQRLIVNKGEIYLCCSDIDNLDRVIASPYGQISVFDRMGRMFGLWNMQPKYVKNIKITRFTNICYINYSIFKHIRLNKLLHSYGLKKDECNEIYSRISDSAFTTSCNIDGKVYADFPHVRIKAIILFEILLRLSDVVLFNTSGLSEQSSKALIKYIKYRMKQFPQKSVIIFVRNDLAKDLCKEREYLNVIEI